MARRISQRAAIDEICQDEPGEFYVYLKKGYRLIGQGNGVSETHGFGADSRKEIADVIRHQIEVCNCDEC